MPKIFIPFNVPSLKNSKVKAKNGIFPSKTCKKYLQKLGIKNYSASKRTFEGYTARFNIFHEVVRTMRIDLEQKDTPHTISFYFVRDSRRKFDFHNAVQIVADLLVAHRVIFDDDIDNFIPMPIKIDGKYYHIDKQKPGVYLYY